MVISTPEMASRGESGGEFFVVHVCCQLMSGIWRFDPCYGKWRSAAVAVEDSVGGCCDGCK